MYSSIAAWSTAFCLIAPSLASHGLIYLSDHHAITGPQELTAEEARLLIAQRLGLSRFHSLEGASSRSIDAINAYGCQRVEDGISQTHEFLLLEGLENADGLFSRSAATPIVLDQSPSNAANDEFFRSLVDQMEFGGRVETHTYSDSYNNGRNSTLDTMQTWSAQGRRGNLMVHSTHMESIASKFGVKSAEYARSFTDLRAALENFVASNNANVVSTIIVLPRESQGFFKRSSTASWGEASKMARQLIPLDSDDLDAWTGSDESDGGRDSVSGFGSDREGDSDLKSSSSKTTTSMWQGNNNNNDDISPLQSDITPPTGILETCYQSMESCETTTHSCSGHGSCQLKYAAQGDDPDCFVCSCQPTRQEVRSGVYKTTVWAGPACQKQDVSAPFWLFATTGVGLLSVVAWGIGLLYSMGSQDLPSVIGAGVAVGGSRSK